MKDIPEKTAPTKNVRGGSWGTDGRRAFSDPYPDRKPAGVGTFLATRILAQAQPPGIWDFLHLTLPELMEQKGIGRVKGNRTFVCVGELSQRIWRTLDAFRSACVYGAGGDRRFLYGRNASQRAGRDAPDDPQYEAEADSGYPAVSGNLQSLSGVSEGDASRRCAIMQPASF